MLSLRNSKERASMVLLMASFLYLLFAAVVVAAPKAEADPLYWNGYSPRNYYDIFLSPAYHTGVAGARQECQNATERYMARENARIAGIGYDYGWVLRERGYDVAIGYSGPSTNRNNSNSWGAEYHLPIHSNAAQGCSNPTPQSVAGTWAIWVSSSGEDLSERIVLRVGWSSPGTNDKEASVNTGITSFDCIPNNGVSDLTEVCHTSAVASYIEAEFHDWNAGVDWLKQKNWQWRIGWALDEYLGYP